MCKAQPRKHWEENSRGEQRYCWKLLLLHQRWEKPSALHLAKCSPEGVQDLAIIPYAEELVGGGDPVSLRCLWVTKYRVWDPDQANHVAVQSQYFHGAVEAKTAVCPRLGKKYINLIFLQRKHDRSMEISSTLHTICCLIRSVPVWSNRVCSGQRSYVFLFLLP